MSHKSTVTTKNRRNDCSFTLLPELGLCQVSFPKLKIIVLLEDIFVQQESYYSINYYSVHFCEVMENVENPWTKNLSYVLK